jgi:hypothetical protein
MMVIEEEIMRRNGVRGRRGMRCGGYGVIGP